MPARTKFVRGFSATMEEVLRLEGLGLKRKDIEESVQLTKSVVTKGLRVYLTSLGRTPDSGRIEIKNKAIELVKQLEADEVSLHFADDTLVKYIREVTGKGRTTYRLSGGAENPDQQLAAYRRVTLQLEGMCYALDKLPEVVHSSITIEQRQEIAARLADCRRIIERRINTVRKDENAEANS